MRWYGRKRNWFQLLLPHHWHCKKKKKSWNVQTCESNQVRRRLWLETYAAFFSYDLITRLFSSTVKRGRTLQIAHCLDWSFFFLSLTWCVCVVRWWTWVWCRPQRCSSFKAACDFSMGTPYKPNYCTRKWRLRVGGWLPDVKKKVFLAVFKFLSSFFFFLEKSWRQLEGKDRKQLVKDLTCRYSFRPTWLWECGTSWVTFLLKHFGSSQIFTLKPAGSS